MNIDKNTSGSLNNALIYINSLREVKLLIQTC